MMAVFGSASCAVASTRGMKVSSSAYAPLADRLQYLSFQGSARLHPLRQRGIGFANGSQNPLRSSFANERHPLSSSRSGGSSILVLAKKKSDKEDAPPKKDSAKKNNKATNGHNDKETNGHNDKETNGHSGVGPESPPVDDNGDLHHFEVPSFDGVEATGHYPDSGSESTKSKDRPKKLDYEKEMDRLKLELVKLQEWIRKEGLKVVVLFEGRDAAGKGGMIKTLTEPLNPRVCYVRALGTPSDRERTQWYFQRYVAHLPAAGEMVVFDRSWYNRAGVEKVMGFCTAAEYQEFLRSCPEFERMLQRAGIILLKYWISVSPDEQEHRFRERLEHPEKRWKLSTMDLYSRSRWSDYSYAKDVMFSYTDTKQTPWFVVPADDKKAARLNCISHLLSQFAYDDLIPPATMKIPPLQEDKYVRPPKSDQTYVPLKY